MGNLGGGGGVFPLGKSLNSIKNTWILGLKLGRKEGISLEIEFGD